MKRKQTIPENGKEEEIKEIHQKSKQQLIFISHDTRDAELAEEFSNLLKSASAGALKSFRSSDKKGTQGIEYGSEWYPAIMEKIDEASDVVCLLTKNSVDRPWILYEAGVAKGKLNKKVIGLALGIPLNSAIGGPFYQFQNNNGDVDSVTKLVLELVNKVPGLDQDQQVVRPLAETFLKKASEIISKIQKEISPEQKTGEAEISLAKLFEEVKIMFEDLPSRIETRIEPDFKRKRRRFHPMMFEEVTRMGMENKDPSLAFLIMVSMYRDDFPWFYEIGLETYRGLKSAKSMPEKKKFLSNFERAFEIFGQPMMREFYGKSDDGYFLFKEGRHFMRDFIERFYRDEKASD